VTLRQHLAWAIQKLARNPAGRLEAEVLLAHALECRRSFLFARPELDIPNARAQQFRDLVRRRQRGEPVAYLTGRREFWSLELEVSPDVLIPRPETETLVAAALDHLPKPGTGLRVADIGTGSGAVALALASERAEAEVHGTDNNPEAIELARRNATRLGLAQVRFHLGDWTQPLTGEFNLIASNPPYVADDDPHLLEGDCRFEPRAALSPGHDPLDAIREITAQATGLLSIGGWLLFEHGFDQGPAVREILAAAGLRSVATLPDLEGRERVSLGVRVKGQSKSRKA